MQKYAVMWASTVNIGDDIQTLAAINFLKKKEITDYTFIDREKLSDYDGEPVTLIMNGWYMHNINKFPPSDKITPVFISVHINNERLISNNINYLKKHEPIGCRDEATVNLFKKYGINAYFTGCLTLLFDDVKEKTGGKYLVDVNTKCNYIPNIDLDTTKYNDFEVIEHDITSKNEYNKPLYISFIFDKNYIDIFITVVKSIILNEYMNYKKNIIFLINYFGKDEDIQILKNLVKKIPENKFYFKNIQTRYINLCKKINDCYDIKSAASQIKTASVYCRFYLDSIWDDINDIILYLDLDIIVKKPISDLFNLFDNEHVLFACPNSTISESIDANFTNNFNNILNTFGYDDKIFDHIKYNLQEAGFNGGVWAINLKKFRDGGYSNKLELCMKVQSKNKIFRHNDQGIMNVVFYKKFKHIDCNWNMLNYGIKYSLAKKLNIYKNLDENFDNAKIIHFNGPDKPWNTVHHFYQKCVDLWKNYKNFDVEYYYCFLTSMSIQDRLTMAENLLNKYRNAELVITTRLHCILPCRAFNTNSIFIHKKYEDDPRFQGLKNIINGDIKIHNKLEGCRDNIENIRNNFLLLKI
jgi:lipopolysaccharide biosynthesis glycosyltransferase